MLSFRKNCFLLFILALYNVAFIRAAKFDVDDCISCVGGDGDDNTMTYCDVGTYFECTPDSTSATVCQGKNYLLEEECTKTGNDYLKLGLAVLTTIIILPICCCLAIIGCIVACICGCCKSGTTRPPSVPGAYQTTTTTTTTATTAPSLPQTPLVLPGTLTTPAITGLATAVPEPPYQPSHHQPPYQPSYQPSSNQSSYQQQSSIPFAEAVSLDQDTDSTIKR